MVLLYNEKISGIVEQVFKHTQSKGFKLIVTNVFLYRTHTNVNDYFPFKYLQFKNQNIAISREPHVIYVLIQHFGESKIVGLAWKYV